MDTIRMGPAPKGSTPFYKEDGRVCFDPQGGRTIDWGHSFDPDRGYRVSFRFQDSPAVNTWKPEDLIQWVEDMDAHNDELKDLKKLCILAANQCISMNTQWGLIGRPASGIPMNTKGSA